MNVTPQKTRELTGKHVLFWFVGFFRHGFRRQRGDGESGDLHFRRRGDHEFL